MTNLQMRIEELETVIKVLRPKESIAQKLRRLRFRW